MLSWLIQDYLNALDQCEKLAALVAKELGKILREVIPDIECEVGTDRVTVRALSASHKPRLLLEKKPECLEIIVNEIVPAFAFHFDGYGVWVTEKEGERIRALLKQALDESELPTAEQLLEAGLQLIDISGRRRNLRETGYVRHIGKDGQVVVPWAIWRDLNLRMGDAVEILVEGQDVILRPIDQVDSALLQVKEEDE